MKGLLKATGRQATLPEDGLSSASLECAYYGHAGFPEATDSLAYSPVQRLLAVGTSDGRVKLVGKPGVEALAAGSDRSGTKHLLFLTGKGALARVTEAGDLQLWGIEQNAVLDSLPCADPITSIAQVSVSPYLCLGCESGNLLFVQLITEGGAPATGVCPARGLELLPYELHVDELGAEGPLIYLSAAAQGDYQRLLGLHAVTGAIVWDVRHQCAVAKTSLATTADSSFGLEESAQSALTSAGPARSACWLGTQGLSFATGHEMGPVLIWVIPPDASGEPPPSPVGAELIMKLVISEGDLAMPIRQLLYVESKRMGDTSSLLVFGGQVLDQPDTLSLVSLDSIEEGGRPEPQSLPWYGLVKGFALVPQKGAIEAGTDPAAVLVLMEGGQLVLFDLPDLQPVPLSLPLQELPDLTILRLACSPAEAGPGSLGLHAATMERIRAAQSLASVTLAVGARSLDRWRWVFDGGRPPGRPPAVPGSSDLLFTGHKDGRVRVWDVTVALPELRATVPFDSGGAGTRLRPVSALEISLESGLLVVGHEKGEVRVYQFSQVANEATSVELSGPNRKASHEEESGRRQPAGFQRILRLSRHAATVRAAAVSPSHGLLACGDDSGLVSVTDLSEPRFLAIQRASELPITALAFAIHPSTKASHDEDHRPMICAVSAEGGVAALDARSASNLGPRIAPKSPDSALSLTLLDSEGRLVSQPASSLVLPWANNGLAPAAAEPASIDAILLGRRLSHRSPLSTPKSQSDPASPASAPALLDAFHLRAGGAAEEAGAPSDELERPQLGAFDRARSSVDEDAFLAAAAQEAEGARDPGGGKRHRLKSFLKGEGPNIRRLLDPREHGKEGAGSREGPASPAAQMTRWKAGEEIARQAEPPSEGDRSRSPSFRDRATVSDRSLASSRDEALPVADYMVVATTSYLRLYPTESLQTGDRTTLRKVTLEEPISLASPFLCRGSPGLACISTRGNLQVFTLPGLELVSRQPLEAVLGFPWSWTTDLAGAAALQQTCSVGLDGQIVLTGAGWEIARLALAHTGQVPAQCSSLFDWDLAAAALAAAEAAGRHRKSAPAEEVIEAAPPLEQSEAPRDIADSLRAGVSEQKKGFGGFLTQVRDGVVTVGANVGTVVDGTGRELGKGISSLVLAGGKRDGSQPGQRNPPPSLDRVLSPTRARTAVDDATETHQHDALQHSSYQRPRQPDNRLEELGSRDSARSELLGDWEQRAIRPGPRTADEIKVAYGRSVSKRAESVGAIAAENRARLEERGEKLGQLSDKTENMANSAKDFASMARAIRDKEANRKWWQL